jgi:hypothetical protein
MSGESVHVRGGAEGGAPESLEEQLQLAFNGTGNFLGRRMNMLFG